MKIQRILRWMSIGLLASTLTGCSTIKSWFPDKERDYQFTSEIPELIIPEDLKNKGLSSLSPQSREPVASAEPESSAPASDSINVSPGQEVAAAPESEPQAPSADETEHAQAPSPAGGNVSSLTIDQAKTQATRMVGRALSRKHIEVVERNIEKGYFYVNFDPNAVEAKDESIWDELTFLFGDDPSQEKEYRITVHQINDHLSEVTVQDSGGNTLSDSVANALLKSITDGINEDESADATEQNDQESPGTKE
ncbi:outer membrane protein assembly factor BamC [Methylomonas sp. MgM2]